MTRLQLMQSFNLTWTEAISLTVWEVAAMVEHLEDIERRRELRDRDSSRLR